ncbi:zinc ribbon domain-containing protein [Haloprofundus halobius]|uniref:zinc ribbon domain-containing protein n=1 Tax=Haloprofundus halobius TaxID=2876194 RepID=UPI003CCD86CD
MSSMKWKCKREDTHYVPVDPAGTTKECAAYGVSTDKPLWVREHSCPGWGFTQMRGGSPRLKSWVTDIG